MPALFLLLILAGLLPGCGGGSPPIRVRLGPLLFVANEGSSSISGFHVSTEGPRGPIPGSPVAIADPPSALAGGGVSRFSLTVSSEVARTITRFEIDIQTGRLSRSFSTSTAGTPKAVVGWRGFLYVANFEGSVSVFREQPDGFFPVAGSPFPAGSGPVAIAATRQGLLYVANSLSDDVSAYTLDPSTGVPTPVPGSPFPAGDQPASLAVPRIFHPVFVYVANRGSNDISGYRIQSDGSLVALAGSPFPAGIAPVSVGVSDNTPVGGGVLFAANEGSNNVSAYRIDLATGALAPFAGSPFSTGLAPRSLVVSFGPLYVANSGSNNVSAFQINGRTEDLTPLAGSPFAVGRSPVMVLFVVPPT